MTKMLSSLVVLFSILMSTSPVRAATTCYLYRIGISGQVADAGVQWFGVNEWVVLRLAPLVDVQTGEFNPWEVFITNFPDQANVFGQNFAADIKNDAFPVGSIELMTDARYANNSGTRASAAHLANVTVSQWQNPPGVLVQFTLNGKGIPGQSDPGGLLLSPNAFKAPGAGTALFGGLNFSLPTENFFGAFSPGGPTTVLQTYVLVPIQGSGYVFIPNANPSSISGQIQVSGVVPDDFHNQGHYLANLQGSFYGSFQCE
jgi:hypothetical protein